MARAVSRFASIFVNKKREAKDVANSFIALWGGVFSGWTTIAGPGVRRRLWRGEKRKR